MKPFWQAFAAGLLLTSLAIITFTVINVSRRLEEDDAAWALTPTIVAAKDATEGHALTYEDLTQRSLPAQFVTASVVVPGDVTRVLEQPLFVALQTGDLLRWGAFTDHAATDACFTAIAPRVRAAGVAAREAVIARFGERLGAPPPPPEPSPTPRADASGDVPVVVLTKDVSAGQVLDESMLAVGKLPARMATASLVPAEHLRDVVGARILGALQAKDALMWQLLDDAKQPRHPASCILEANAAQDEARERATREEAAAFVRGQEPR